jgi:DNA adenine methylase
MTNTEASPFIKWVGGKRQLLKELTLRMPDKYNRYYEPFIGGGALYFHVCPKKAFINDINPDLVNAYQVIKNDLEALIVDLGRHRNTEEYYYKMRDADLKKSYLDWEDVRKASRLIYLNKTCFNGLHRTNASGHFNVAYGSYDNPKILDKDNLIACSSALKGATIRCGPFSYIIDTVKPKDFVYLDPPYAPITKSSSFTRYYKGGFNQKMQVELKEFCDALDKKNVLFMMSNSNADIIRELYADYNLQLVDANRKINCNGSKRGKIKEVIVTNY